MSLKIFNENELSSQIKSAFRAEVNTGTNSNGDFYFNLTVGLATAGGCLLFLISFIISCICHRRGYCTRTRQRRIYGQQQDDDKLINCVNGVGLEMALIETCTTNLVNSTSQDSSSRQGNISSNQPTTSQNENPYVPTTVYWQNELKRLKDQQKKASSDFSLTSKKIREATASLNQLKKVEQLKTLSAAEIKNNKNHPSTNILLNKRNK